MGSLAVASLAVLVVCLQFGATQIEFTTVLEALAKIFQAENNYTDSLGTSGTIMVQIRLPRVLM
jgi:ABC-type Fe3+-siderophore transport system permease subunit